MINHVSISAKNAEKVASVIAEIWNGYAMPFPPCPGSFIVMADDGKGSAIEVTPFGCELRPGVGEAFECDDLEMVLPFEAQFTPTATASEFSITHIAINTPLNEDQIKSIGEREGWRTITCNRGGGLFTLIELWLENRILIEVFTPEMTRKYIEFAQPQVWANLLQMPLPEKVSTVGAALN
jgi:hypothetical protein